MDQQGQSRDGRAPQKNPGTPLKPAEPEQLAMIEALAEEELERLKTRLFSALAHELRTPLASIRLAAGLLVTSPPAGVTEDHQKLFQLILHSSDRLDLLVTSLLDYARLEAKHLQLEMQTLDLRLILESAVTLLEPQYRAKRQMLDISLPAEPVNVHGDPFRLKSAVQAVLDTACKRCPEDGRLSLGCQMQDEYTLGWICDTGTHVPEAARAHVFSHNYWQTTEEPSSLAAFGLGLPLAHGLIALHGGNLWLEEPETEGAGMCFHFRLPLANI